MSEDDIFAFAARKQRRFYEIKEEGTPSFLYHEANAVRNDMVSAYAWAFHKLPFWRIVCHMHVHIIPLAH